MALWVMIVWLVIGALAGILARKIVGGTAPFGLSGDAILGLAGGVIGGYLIALAGLGNTWGGLIATLVAAVAGAVLVVWSTRFIRRT